MAQSHKTRIQQDAMAKADSAISVPDMWAAKAAIELAFRRLKPVPVSDGGTYLGDFHDVMIDYFSEELALLVFPPQLDPPLKATRLQLRNLEKHGEAFWRSMVSLQGPAIDALSFNNSTLGEFQRAIESLLKATSRAKKEKSGSSRKGPKSKARAREIAIKAADYYARLTGKPPVRITYGGNKRAASSKDKKAVAGGEFFDFLTAVFNALCVIASADRYGKVAIRVWKDNRARSTK